MRTSQESRDKSSGPEQPTLIERFVGFFPIPYVITCVILALVTGSPGFRLVQYLDSGTVILPSTPLDYLSETVFTVLPFYCFFAVRYMRLKIVASEPNLVSLSPNGEETYHRAFKRVTSKVGPLILTALTVPLLLYSELPSSPGPITSGFDIAITLILALGYASAVWVYISSVWGLHTLGKTPMRLKAFYEDRMLGVGQMGSLSLSLMYVYFIGIGLALLIFSSQPALLTLLVAFVLLGTALFFLPLSNIHTRMREVKKKELATVRANFKGLFTRLDGGDSANEQSTLSDLRTMMAHDMIERKALSIATWPFDTSVLGRVAVIILSVTAILISRIIQIVLHL